jgi:hypothetical protein
MITERKPIALALVRSEATHPTATSQERAEIVAKELNLPLVTVLAVVHELENKQ